jgi:hypothetical protein
MVSTLQHESGQTFDADYVTGQVYYQRANSALYQYEIGMSQFKVVDTIH